MELRVWVDGTQRVVCGVKLTTTCQEIVFALAHATQQAGRFTMIERWRNNERLLSPNEQPLVTLQRWGDHMNEVEFILRKTSSDPPPPPPPQPQPQPTSQQQAVNNLISSQHQQQLSPKQPQQQQQPQDLTRTNNEINNKPTQQQQQIPPNSGTVAPTNPIASNQQQQLLNDQTYDNIYRHRPGYNLNPASRRPQTMLGPLTSSNSTTSLGPSYLSNNNSHHALNRLSANFRPSLSASTLPNTNTNMAPSPSNPTSIMRSHYTSDDQMIMNNSPSMSNNYNHNGYSIRNESQFHQTKLNNNQTKPDQVPPQNNSNTNNHQLEDLYSTINKRRFNQPPVVPAKPRVMNPIGNVPITQNVYNAQMNYYHPNQSPASLCSNNNIRPRHPPGYLDYMEALANRNSLPQPIIPNSSHMNHQQQHHHHQNVQGNMFPQRNYDPHSGYDFKQNNSSPTTSSTMTTTSNKFGYPTNGQTLPNNGHSLDLSSSSSQSFSSPINSRLLDSGLVINRGSAVNIKLASNSQNRSKQPDERLNTSTHSNSSSSVSQIGHDMLKVIEEQKRLLMNQKNELEKLDIDQEYWDAQQNTEQTELINRIESEIRQLEELWKENQTQINKLENQDFAGLLEKLKAEQIKMEDDIEVQRIKLAQCENDIVQCKTRIEQLEFELTEQEGSVSSDDEEEVNEPPLSNKAENSAEKKKSKDVAYVDKRGLISGIRSLKLDHKSRLINRQMDASHQQQTPSLENLASLQPTTITPNLNGQTESIENNNLERNKSPIETNGHFNEKTANKYEFLMTL